MKKYFLRSLNKKYHYINFCFKLKLQKFNFTIITEIQSMEVFIQEKLQFFFIFNFEFIMLAFDQDTNLISET